MNEASAFLSVLLALSVVGGLLTHSAVAGAVFAVISLVLIVARVWWDAWWEREVRREERTSGVFTGDGELGQ